MEFWTTLIRVTKEPTGEVLQTLKRNCTHVRGDFWIMEGDVDYLRDEGVVLEEVAEGAVGALGGLSPKQLINVCLDSYGFRIPAPPPNPLSKENEE